MFGAWSRNSELRSVHSVWWSLRVALASLALALPQTLQAQDAPPPPTIPRNPNVGANITAFFTAKTPYEFWLTCMIGILGLAIIGFLVFALRRLQNPRPEDISRPIIVITVIIGTLMLVTVGYSNDQIAPAFGLFGTIVGYMLGRLSSPSPAADSRPHQRSDDAVADQPRSARGGVG